MHSQVSTLFMAFGLALGALVLSSAEALPAGLGLAKKKAKPPMEEQVRDAMERFVNKDEGIARRLEKVPGYVIFPKIYKAGIGLGGAGGKGWVFEKGAHAGDASLKQATIGFQLGAQAYSELILFQDQETLDEFKTGNFEFSAQVSAVAADVGASDKAAFDQGFMVFTLEIGGLMYEASVGGQKFSYTPKP